MKKKITFTLKENGLHSLERGLTTFKEFEQTEEMFLLKEAIMFLHHGIELLMKQTLVENIGEVLIFSDIDNETVKKVIKANKEGKSVFNLPKPIHTATYEQVLDRVQAFVITHELPENLRSWLSELNTLRNQIEHYAIDKEVDDVKDKIVKIRKPLLSFFEKTIKDFTKSKNNEIEAIGREWEEVGNQIETERKIVQQFDRKNIVIVCEGETDNIVLKLLIDKAILKYNLKISYEIIVANGLPYFSKNIRNMIAHTNTNFIVVTDGDGKITEREIQLLRIGIPIDNQIIIEPEIEIWLFLDYDKSNHPKFLKNNKAKLAEIVNLIDIEELAQRQSSFAKLLTILKKIGELKIS